MPDEHENDLFMSYSYADSEAIVEALVGELEAFGLEVWYDGMEVGIGDSVRESIDEGMQSSRYGVVVLSDGYFEGTSEWELNGLVKMHTQEGNVILPVWHGVSHNDVYEQSPSLADLHAEELTEETIQSIAAELYRIVSEGSDGSEWGVEDEETAGDFSFTDVGIRFQDRFDPEIGKQVTIKSWRNHHAPRFNQLEATEIRDEDRGIDYTSRSKGTIMTIKRIDDEPIQGVISSIKTLQSGKTEFTMRVRESRLNELSDDPSDYRAF